MWVFFLIMPFLISTNRKFAISYKYNSNQILILKIVKMADNLNI